MPVVHLDAVQLWALASVIGLTLAAWSFGGESARGFPPSRRCLAWLETGSARAWTIVFVACLAFSADAIICQWKHPVPEVLDEFSYVLQADTFAHGRLTNPPPPLAQPFEAPYVLVRPTYQGRYPPGQALFLALGERLFSHPLVGVWLSSAAFAAALCWMLQAWVSPTWALWGSVLAICQLGCFGHWAQSYWGGMVAAAGGALLYGALRRLVTSGRLRIVNAAIFAIGLTVMANTRPFEGLVTAIPAVIVLGASLRRSRRAPGCNDKLSTSTTAIAGRNLPRRNGSLSVRLTVIVPILSVLAAAGALMLYYNQRVTHDAWKLPYVAYEQQYNPAPILFFQRARPMPSGLTPAMESSAIDALTEMHWARQHFLDFVTSKLFFFWQFAFGALLGLPVLLVVFAKSRNWPLRIVALLAYAAVQVIALQRFLFWPMPSEYMVAALLVAILVDFALLVYLFSGYWERLALLVIGLVLLATLAETARFRTHYVASIIPLTLFLVTEAMHHLAVAEQRIVRVLPVAVAIPFLALVTAAAASFAPPTPIKVWAQRRLQLETRLASLPGKQLVFVRYPERYDYYEEWVYNHADLEHAKVIWARDLGSSMDDELMRYFSDRKVWWLEAATGDLEAHPPTESNELQVLP